jgi:hypothetical protein
VSAGTVVLNYGVTNRPTPVVVERETRFTNRNGIGTKKNLVMGPEIKNDCAGEDHQQFTVPGY